MLQGLALSLCVSFCFNNYLKLLGEFHIDSPHLMMVIGTSNSLVSETVIKHDVTGLCRLPMSIIAVPVVVIK